MSERGERNGGRGRGTSAADEGVGERARVQVGEDEREMFFLREGKINIAKILSWCNFLFSLVSVDKDDGGRGS